MKFAIYGAGAVGCVIGARLHLAGAEVTLIARGAHLDTLQQQGLQFDDNGTRSTLPLRALASAEEAGVQDAVFLCCKSYDLPAIAPQLAPMLADHTTIIPVGNGIPWWYFHLPNIPLSGFTPPCLDPERLLQAHIAPERILGGVCYMGASVTAPGCVKNVETPRVVIGEPALSTSPRLTTFGGWLEKAGFNKPTRTNIREIIWWKLCWNIAFNPLSVITGKNCAEMVADDAILARVRAIIAEMNQLGTAIGLTTLVDAGQHIQGAATMGAFKPSMLQDAERGKRLEIEAIITAAVEIAGKAGISVPTLEALHEEIQKFS